MPGVHPDLPQNPGQFDANIADLVTTRLRWGHSAFFVLAGVGSSIGLGNIWKFPSLTWKHGGSVFVGTYAGVMILVGLPLLIMEIALGQKF